MRDVEEHRGGTLIDGVFYPDWEKSPMGESLWHENALRHLISSIEELYHDCPDHFVTGDVPWFYERGNPESVRAPDVMVVKGVRITENVRSFASFEWNALPCFIAEITSKSTYKTDLSEKVPLFIRLGVREVFLFDPDGEYLETPLMGFRRGENGEPVRIEQGEFGLWSEELNSWVCQVGRFVRLRDPHGNLRPTPQERADAAEERADEAEQLTKIEKERADAEKARADAEKERADAEKERTRLEKERAAAEKQRADAAEERASQLAAEVARLRAALKSSQEPPSV